MENDDLLERIYRIHARALGGPPTVEYFEQIKEAIENGIVPSDVQKLAARLGAPYGDSWEVVLSGVVQAMIDYLPRRKVRMN